jgi:tetratricopeptide (TPR) repeat protein
MVSLFCNCMLRFFTGDTLVSVTESLNQSKQLAMDYNQYSAEVMSAPLLQVCYNLMGLSGDPFILNGEAMDEESWRAKAAVTDTNMFAFLAVLKLLIAVYLNQSEQFYLNEFRRQDPGIVIPYLYNYTTFFEGLVEASKPSPWSQWRARRKLRYLEKAMLRQPENYANKVFLIRAILASTSGQYEHALIAFDKAIHYARIQGWVHEQGLANEKAAKMLASCGRTCDAKRYYVEALKCYRQWGAKIKVVQLESVIAKHLM